MNAENEKKRRPELTDAELRAAEAFLRAHDPGLAFPQGLSEERGRRIVRCMEHPLLATIYLHHRTAALLGALLVLALLLAALFAIREGVQRRLTPVDILLVRPDAAPDAEVEDAADRPLDVPDPDLPDVLPGPDLPEPDVVEPPLPPLEPSAAEPAAEEPTAASEPPVGGEENPDAP